MQYDFYSLESLGVKDLKAIITQENIHVKSNYGKQDLINAIRLQYIENLIHKNFVASYVNPKIVYLDTRNVYMRYSTKTYNINHLLDDLRKYNPSISVLPGETKSSLQYNDIFEVNRVIYYLPEEFLIVELKNGMFMFVNIIDEYYADRIEYEVYVTSFYDKIIQHLTVDQYTMYFENTVSEEELNAYETRDFRIRTNRVPPKQEFLYFLEFYQKIQMDTLYWTHLNLYSDDINYILYKFDNKYHYAIFVVNETGKYSRIHVNFLENKSYGTYKEAIMSMLPNDYNMYLAETTTSRDTKVLSHIFTRKNVREFENLFKSIQGEAIDIRNLTKDKTKFFGLENIKKYHMVKLHFDTFELNTIVSLKDRKKSVVIYELPDYFIAFTFYISSLCKGVEFECVSMMTDVKQYVAYTYEDLLRSFSDSDYEAYYE